MEQIKRQLSNNVNHYDNFKRQKIQITTDETDCSRRKSISHFENLSNELIYEIFEYLDYFHVYNAFFNLNQRFHNVVNYSNLPIKINISSMSKSMFKHYNEDIIKSNTHRITSFHFGDVFMNDFVFLSIPKLSEFQRLKTLILYDIEPTHLENLLNQLCSFSLLSSLVISSIETVSNKSIIYRQILRLPSLKYCKLSVPGWTSGELLPVCINEYSSIEHIIIVSAIYSNEVDRLLSYVPQLHRLSLHALSINSDKMTTICSSLSNYLTHVSFKQTSIKFDQFIQVFRDVLRNVEVLHFTVEGYNIDREYMDANKWKHMILTYMPKLRIFDFAFGLFLHWGEDLPNIKTEINQFTSSFWIERQWFVTHHVDRTHYRNRLFFHSSNPYRKKHYTLYEQVDKTNSLYEYKSNSNSVQYVHIQSGQSIVDCKYYFPNASETIFERGFSTTHASMINILNSILPLNQLTKLVIECAHFSVQRVIKILYHTPHIHTLMLKSMPCYKQRNDYTSIQQSEEFQFVSNNNTIENVTCDNVCKLEQIKLLVALCPRMKYLTINRRTNDIESIIRLLLDKTNPNTRHLCVLCFSRAWNNWSDKVDQLIKSETLLNNYTLKQINWNLYLWW